MSQQSLEMVQKFLREKCLSIQVLKKNRCFDRIQVHGKYKSVQVSTYIRTHTTRRKQSSTNSHIRCKTIKFCNKIIYDNANDEENE